MYPLGNTKTRTHADGWNKSLPETAIPWTPVYSMHLSISHKLDAPTSRMNGRETESLDKYKIKQHDIKIIIASNIPYNSQWDAPKKK